MACKIGLNERMKMYTYLEIQFKQHNLTKGEAIDILNEFALHILKTYEGDITRLFEPANVFPG